MIAARISEYLLLTLKVYITRAGWLTITSLSHQLPCCPGDSTNTTKRCVLIIYPYNDDDAMKC